MKEFKEGFTPSKPSVRDGLPMQPVFIGQMEAAAPVLFRAEELRAIKRDAQTSVAKKAKQ